MFGDHAFVPIFVVIHKNRQQFFTAAPNVDVVSLDIGLRHGRIICSRTMGSSLTI